MVRQDSSIVTIPIIRKYTEKNVSPKYILPFMLCNKIAVLVCFLVILITV